MGSIGRETGQGKVGMCRGEIENILDNAAKKDGMTKTQCKCWKQAGNIDTEHSQEEGSILKESKKEKQIGETLSR